MRGTDSGTSRPALTPEQLARIASIKARNHTDEARAEEIRDRELLAEEFRRTGAIATAGEFEPEALIRIRQFIERLRRYREDSGISLKTVSERSGLDVPALSRLENGRGNPTFHTFSRYIQALGLVSKFDYEIATR
jgi:DNA-binding phage protein